MVFQLQPEIVVNNRNGLEGDFSTPEQHIEAAKEGRAWETCMTLNGSWGFQKSDDDWKPPKTIVDNLATCARGGGNYLLNIGPKPDGSVPDESVRILEAVGKWLDHNGQSIYATERGNFSWGTFSNYTRRGNTLYIHVYNWPGDTPAEEWLSFYQPSSVIAIGGLQAKVCRRGSSPRERPCPSNRTSSLSASRVCPKAPPTLPSRSLRCDAMRITSSIAERYVQNGRATKPASAKPLRNDATPESRALASVARLT